MTDTIRPIETTNGGLEPTFSPRPDLATAHEDLGSDRAPLTARLERRLREGRAWAEQRTHQAGESVRAHPVRSSLGALGLGVVVGMLLRR